MVFSEEVLSAEGFSVEAGALWVCTGVWALPRRFSRCPGRIRSGSEPTVLRFAAYKRSQPPWTCRESAMPESVSPWTTVYISAVPACDWGVVCGFTSRTERCVVWGEVPDGLMSGVSPPLVSPARTEHTGQAPGPWPRSTFSAMAICWSLVA